MKKIYLILFVISIFNACKNSDSGVLKDNNYTIEGELNEKINGTVLISFFNGADYISDTINVKQGVFTYQNKTIQPELAILYIPNPNSNGRSQFVFFTEGNKKIKINIQSVENKKYSVSGSSANDEFFSFKKTFIEPIELQEQKVIQSINPDNIDNQKTLDSLLNLSTQLQEQKNKAILDYLKTHPNSITITAFALWMNANNNDINFFKNVYSIVDKSVQQSNYGITIEKLINSSNDLSVGNTVKDFITVDKEGKTIQLSSVYKKNKIVLLEFWSSRCVPCRKENPNLLNLFHQYHSKGLEIVGVSVDDNRENWIKAIDQDQLPWIQICDLKAWNGAIPKQYNITETPTLFLIDNKGTILDINLKGEALQLKLKTIFN